MNNKSNLTIVTALFDLGRGSIPDGFARPFDHYKECAKRMMEINYNMVIYVPPELNDFIWQHRQPHNTKIVNKTLDDLRRFPFYNEVQKIRTDPAWIAQAGWLPDSPQARMELYNPFNNSKMFFVNDATLFNFFNTDLYVWVDFALSNTIGQPSSYFDDQFESRITPWIKDKMLFINFPYDKDAPEVHGFTKSALDAHAGSKTEYVCRGGLFGGNRVSINDMNNLYYQLMSSCYAEHKMGTEESLFTILAHKFPEKINLGTIEGNGLIYKFLQDLKTQALPQPKQHPLAWYFLVYNTPRQLEYTVNKWKAAYSEDFNKVKKYVINNSNDPTVNDAYHKLFEEYDMECIKDDGNNIGIHSGRIFAAEHFDKSNHDYYIFIEEDMGVYEKGKDPATCAVGFTTHHEGLFDKAVHIMEGEKLDVLRLTYSEFFGESNISWNFVNFPQEWKDKVYPPVQGLIPAKTYAANVLNKTKIDYIGTYKGLSFAVGDYHVSNWPILFNKHGNHIVYLKTVWAHPYEATTMSHAAMERYNGKIKVGCLLASPILHNRIYHYDGTRRRENSNYTN